MTPTIRQVSPNMWFCQRYTIVKKDHVVTIWAEAPSTARFGRQVGSGTCVEWAKGCVREWVSGSG